MKTLHYSIIISGVLMSVLAYLLLVPTTDKILWDTSLANETASKYGIFPHETDWHVHVTTDGKI
ncbi:MAG TPA: hypothetical protein VFJ23_01535, partial [Candidatus Nitrosotalea sp.]|nr:hypothetical protein [Candidatus Nitrosotalea sp.]